MSLTRPQSARAWVNFNGTGTVAIRDSFNVSSITDNGTGDYTVNFDQDMPNANYCVSGTAPSNNTTSMQYMRVYDSSSQLISSVRVITGYVSSSGQAQADHGLVSTIIFGDAS